LLWSGRELVSTWVGRHSHDDSARRLVASRALPGVAPACKVPCANNAPREEKNDMQDLLDREPKTEAREEHREGSVARSIEQQTAKLPSDAFLWAAAGSIVGSLVFMAMGDGKKSTFVGQWAPTLLILGLYNKMVKLHGSEGR
jgi:hypothetical protein